MKKLTCVLIPFIFIIMQSSIVHADKDQIIFSLQKVKSNLEKAQSKSDEAKISLAELQKSRDFIKQAEAEFNKNKNLIGSLKKDAEPRIMHLTEMADIEISIALAKLEKLNQIKENDRLEKLIPKITSQIKVFDDKNIEIKRLKEEIENPKIKMQKLEQSESDKLTGKIEALNEIVISLRKDLVDKTRVNSDLSTENKSLKESMKLLESQKGSDLIELQKKVVFLDSKQKKLGSLCQFGFLSKISENGYTLIVPRKKLFKTNPHGHVLSEDAMRYIAEFADSMKSFPESRLIITVRGFGKPANKEDNKATESMAKQIKEEFIKHGISESTIQTVGAGSGSPMFSKGAVEENRCIELAVSSQV